MRTIDGCLVRNVLLAWAFASLGGCSQASNDPCTELCDGIVRCRMGNDACVAAGMTAREPFMTDCVAVCGDIEQDLTDAERSDAIACLECLRSETSFAECNGEMLLDEACAADCRNEGSIAFRNNFYPTLFDDYGCLGNP